LQQRIYIVGSSTDRIAIELTLDSETCHTIISEDQMKEFERLAWMAEKVEIGVNTAKHFLIFMGVGLVAQWFRRS